MKRLISALSACLLLAALCGSAWAGSPDKPKNKRLSYVIGFYNLENLFDTYHDEGKNDYQYLPEGENNWTEQKYAKKLSNMAHVIAAMKEDNKAWHAVLGVSEIENRHVLEDLVVEPEIAASIMTVPTAAASTAPCFTGRKSSRSWQPRPFLSPSLLPA